MNNKLLLLFLLLLILASCTPKALYKDAWVSSIFEDKKCDLPCWENITPGETTWGEAYAILSNNPQVENLTHDLHSDLFKNSQVFWDFKTEQPDKYNDVGMLWVDTDSMIVTRILLNPISSEIRLSEFLDEEGEPENYFFEIHFALTTRCFFVLTYPEKGITLEIAPKCGRSKVNFREDDTISSFFLVDYQSFKKTINDSTSEIHDWQGFGRQPY